MKTNFYLVVNNNGTVTAKKNRPDLKWNEVSIEMNLTLPDMLFRKPHLSATIVVPDEAAAPKLVNVETADNIKDAIETVTGMEVKIEIVGPVTE